MIIWLASYPKSGNTLLRSMLAAYLFSEDGNYNFNLIKNIKQFPHGGFFLKMGIDISNQNETIKNYIKAQEAFNKKDAIQFLKTHSFLFNFNKNYPFTNFDNTLGVIYIVRDPRNIVTSYANHNSLSVEEAANDLIKNMRAGGNLNHFNPIERTMIYVGTWGSHYKSWQSFKSQGKYLLIKYEDLINKKEEVLLKMLKFIYKLNKKILEIDKVKLKNVIDSTSFEKMKDLEKETGFRESKINPNTGKKIPFFNLGKKNDWKKMIDPKIKKKLENAFKKEMQELGYM